MLNRCPYYIQLTVLHTHIWLATITIEKWFLFMKWVKQWIDTVNKQLLFIAVIVNINSTGNRYIYSYIYSTITTNCNCIVRVTWCFNWCVIVLILLIERNKKVAMIKEKIDKKKHKTKQAEHDMQGSLARRNKSWTTTMF